MNRYLTKIAVRLDLYEDKKGKRKWVAEGRLVPQKSKPVKTYYKRKGKKGQQHSSKRNKYLTKIAKQEQSKLRPQQEEALKKLDKTKGIILHHGLGSGKTLTFLTAAAREQAKDKKNEVFFVAPAPLVTNIDKEIKKHKIPIDRKRLLAYSYEKAVNMSDELKGKKFSLAVADEAHRLRNTGTRRNKELSEIFGNADKRLLATGTANYNAPHDAAALINIAAGYEALPTDKKEFSKKYIGVERQSQGLVNRILGKKPELKEALIRKKELGEIFSEHTHTYDPQEDPEEKHNFPEKVEQFVETEMSPQQIQYYKFVENDLPFLLKMKIRHGLPLDKQEKVQLNSFSTGVRQASNSYRHLTSQGDKAEIVPKIYKAVSSLEKGFTDDKNFKALVYSNYLDAGVHEYAKALDKKKIKYGLYTGALSREEKDKMRDDFNSGKLSTLLVSSSGTEGLDLKGVKKIQILDPHFNKQKLNQVIGRGVRYKSHAHLPKEERKVEVEHYLSVYPKDMLGRRPMSIDQYLSQMGDDKQGIFDEIRKVMKDNN